MVFNRFACTYSQVVDYSALIQPVMRGDLLRLAGPKHFVRGIQLPMPFECDPFVTELTG